MKIIEALTSFKNRPVIAFWPVLSLELLPIGVAWERSCCNNFIDNDRPVPS